MNRNKILGIIPIVMIALSMVAGSICMVTTSVTKASSAVPLSTIKDEVKSAYNYLMALKRTEGYYAVISEYPSVPIVVKAPSKGWWWVPGLKYYISSNAYGETYLYVTIRDESITNEYYGTSYIWYEDLRFYSYDEEFGVTNVTYATLKVKEYRGYPYSYVQIYVTYSIIDSMNAEIYLAGNYVGLVKQGNSYYVSIPDSPMPSMRTSVRHVDVIGALALANLAGYSEQQDLWSFAQSMMYNVFQTDMPLYDIYNAMFQGLEYTGKVDKPNELHFYDAHYFSYGLGYSKIWNVMNSNGWIWRNYPIYPYKSKIVAVAEETHQNGGAYFLTLSALLSDPLYHEWWGLYYCYVGDYTDALSEWNSVVAHWDGTGIHVNGQEGYSTLRLALAIILGSILASKGYISWDTVHDMANVLVQLQWQGSGEWSPDGNTVIWVNKPDHTGGFLVSYGPIGSYGYVPFRNPNWESIIDWFLQGVAMPPEYGGIVPTNAETTIISLTALMQYAHYYYGVSPSQLLS